MTKHELLSKITEILLLAQYDAYIEKDNPNPTAQWLENKQQRAINYYQGITKNPLDITPVEQVKFNHIINSQAALIMRQLEKFLA